MSDGPPRHTVTLPEATRLWARIGLNSFGGPAGQIAVMHRELVERHRWVSERRFLHALNYCMILPGPEAQQLATYIGWLMHGRRGGLIAGVLFIVPGFLVMLVLSAAYALYGDITWVRGLLFGLQAAVVALVAEAVLRIGRRTLRSPALRMLAAAAFVAMALLGVPFPLIIVAAAVTGWAVGRRRPDLFPTPTTQEQEDEQPTLLHDDDVVSPTMARRALRAGLWCLILWLVPVGALLVTLGVGNVFTDMALLFSKTAVVTFGGAYAVLGYVTQEAVNHYGWLTPQEMITGLGLAETTPGPLILVLQFVGFLAAYQEPGSLPPLLAGTLGAVLTVWVTFVPCFMFIFLGAPYVERLRHNVALAHALTAVGAAVAGVVLNLAVWFAIHTAFGTVGTATWGPLTVPVPDPSSLNVASIAISLVAAVLVFRLRWGTLRVLGVCAVVGMVVSVLSWS